MAMTICAFQMTVMKLTSSLAFDTICGSARAADGHGLEHRGLVGAVEEVERRHPRHARAKYAAEEGADRAGRRLEVRDEVGAVEELGVGEERDAEAAVVHRAEEARRVEVGEVEAAAELEGVRERLGRRLLLELEGRARWRARRRGA